MLTAGLTIWNADRLWKGEEKKTYDQACADLAQGSYDYALQGYQSSITAGYKTAEAYRGPESQIFILEIIRMPLTA